MLYLIEILHQTTTRACVLARKQRCILSKFYIKPQPMLNGAVFGAVVSYRNSTSNHNLPDSYVTTSAVVSYRNSTSNHNTGLITGALGQLYLIEILHQTTTHDYRFWLPDRLYLIEILHQTTTLQLYHPEMRTLYLIEILHQTTTMLVASGVFSKLYLIEILHQTTTILTQFVLITLLYLIEILHQTTTTPAFK